MNEIPDESWDVERLLKALEDGDVGSRIWAAMALGDTGDDRVVMPLIHALEEDKSEDVRQFAAFALGKIEDCRAIISLLRALSDDDKDVGSSAAKALHRHPNKKRIKEGARSLLIEVQSNKEKRMRVADAIAFQPDLQCIFKEAGEERSIEKRIYVATPSKDIKDSVKKVLDRYDMEAVTVEELLLNDICESVQSCSYGLADISDPHSSVLYELGVMHALGKPCIVLKSEDEEDEQPSLDALKIEYLSYKSLQEMEEKLSKWIGDKIG
ncbi:MAG: HEAT repeat domain-containing protein [Halobacteriota archaeon]|nr:HEAT repeat domain-containing protein [Halobacteriota archaeon]